MGLRSIYSQVEAQLNTILNEDGSPVFLHYHTWNNQFRDFKGKSGQNKDVSIPSPAVFMEVVVDKIEQQGQANQLLDCTLNLHIYHDFYNAQYGEYEQDWSVFDIVDKVFQKMQCFKADLTNQMIRTGLKQDYDHTNVYHFVDTYKFNYECVYVPSYIYATATTLSISGLTSTIITY